MVKRRILAAELKKTWGDFKAANPRKRIREAAHDMGVSEMELLATGLGENVTMLQPKWKEIIAKVGEFGYVMALTRNEACVHERKGIYKSISENKGVGLVVGEDIDLRIFYHPWSFGFAVIENTGKEIRRSLQFFDKSGTAIHKIYLNEKSNAKAFDETVSEFQMQEIAILEVEPILHENKELLDSEIDSVSFLTEWRNLKDTHDFFGLIKKYKVTRTQALRLAEGQFTERLDFHTVRNLLEKACHSGLEIMVFVGNHGMIQIHTGSVKNFKVMENWINIMDPEFNLHLREDLIDKVWFVKKPTADGDVHSLEVFDTSGEMIVQFFGKRKPGIPEKLEWRQLVTALI
jgi:putative hemin transport protein